VLKTSLGVLTTSLGVPATSRGVLMRSLAAPGIGLGGPQITEEKSKKMNNLFGNAAGAPANHSDYLVFNDF